MKKLFYLFVTLLATNLNAQTHIIKAEIWDGKLQLDEWDKIINKHEDGRWILCENADSTLIFEEVSFKNSKKEGLEIYKIDKNCTRKIYFSNGEKKRFS